MFHFSNIVRTKGDPKIVEGGPSLKRPEDQLARALGWFSIGLGVVELFAPRRVTKTLGMEGHETLVRAFGVREIAAGVMSLSVDKNAGLWARVGGDGLDAAALLSGLTADNPKKGNIALALLMVIWSPPVGDLAAQVFRTELFEQRCRHFVHPPLGGRAADRLPVQFLAGAPPRVPRRPRLPP